MPFADLHLLVLKKKHIKSLSSEVRIGINITQHSNQREEFLFLQSYRKRVVCKQTHRERNQSGLVIVISRLQKINDRPRSFELYHSSEVSHF